MDTAIANARPNCVVSIYRSRDEQSASASALISSSRCRPDGTGTRAAIEQLTRPDLAAALLEKLRRPDGSLPESFEVVVGARFHQDYPLEITYVTHREH